ncbi:hypothetical protein [Erythrobacter sp. HL-111]|uniref:hypothetical protein n=1 Tax=Erythrobacter sp. HL-111 TaxID=1798193 RepID=UPI0006D99627|nr:hypothetical protein [Erythrobacter sp. HL-111]KPP94044.1 MAG: Bacterial Transmembrane Pair family [Erythrobacteraceae bacterium HL-111]SDS59306.1 hypothetical protein SAMN04515621_1849 [Erythrobacter sp. HL-111]
MRLSGNPAAPPARETARKAASRPAQPIRLPPATTFGALLVVIAVPLLAMLAIALGIGFDKGAGEPRAGLWPALFTGGIAAILSAWIWSLRTRDGAALLFCASGAMTYAFCLGAAVFSLPLASWSLRR